MVNGEIRLKNRGQSDINFLERGDNMPIPEQLKLTYDDYLNFPNDRKRHEIIDGEHYITPAPQTRHQIVSRNIEQILVNYIEENDLGLSERI